MQKKFLIVGGILLILVLLLGIVGCTDPEAEPEEPAEEVEEVEAEPEPEEEEVAEPEGPQHGGELIIGDFADANTLDPHYATAAVCMRRIENMYSTLFRHKEGVYGEIEKELVSNYEISDDTVYTFELHEGVLFHNGDPLTSEDVKYSIRRIMDEGARAEQFSAVDKIETPDELTVEIHLEKPVAPFLTYLAYPMNAVVNQAVVEENDGTLDNVDGGSGPFKLDEWLADQHVALERFDQYFEEDKPYLDRIVWRPMPSDTGRMTALRNEEIHLSTAVPLESMEILEEEAGVVVEAVDGTWWEYIGLNTQEEPFDDVRVRQAIAWAVDREEISAFVKFGEADVLTGGPIPHHHTDYADLEMYEERDLARAEELLQEAGYEDGFEVTLKVGSDFEEQVQAAQIISQQLSDLNIDVTVSSLDSGVFFDDLNNQDFQMTVVGWTGFVDPDEFLYEIFHTDGIYNQQAYSNPELDQLLEDGRTELDPAARSEIYYEAQEIIAKEAPMVFLYVNPEVSAYLEPVQGFDVHPTLTTKSLRDTWLEQ